jgi:hypothetical protein
VDPCLCAVIARLDRAVQLSTVGGYWIARSTRATMPGGPTQSKNTPARKAPNLDRRIIGLFGVSSTALILSARSHPIDVSMGSRLGHVRATLHLERWPCVHIGANLCRDGVADSSPPPCGGRTGGSGLGQLALLCPTARPPHPIPPPQRGRESRRLKLAPMGLVPAIHVLLAEAPQERRGCPRRRGPRRATRRGVIARA